jgi:hypothetical protein
MNLSYSDDNDASKKYKNNFVLGDAIGKVSAFIKGW